MAHLYTIAISLLFYFIAFSSYLITVSLAQSTASTTAKAGEDVCENQVIANKCPDDNGKTIRDASGELFSIGCAQDVTPGQYFDTSQVSKGYLQCLALCTAHPNDKCQAVVFSGSAGAYGVCYFKTFANNATQTPQPGADDLVMAIRPDWLKDYVKPSCGIGPTSAPSTNPVMALVTPVLVTPTSSASSTVLMTAPSLAASSSTATPAAPQPSMSWPNGTILAKCPGGATNYTSPAGTVYELCPNTELSGANAQTLQNVATLRACAVRCGAINGCTKALYDRGRQICMIKPSDPDVNQPWVANTQYDSVRAVPRYNSAVQGQWTDFIRLPVVPVAAYVVPAFPTAARLLFFSAWSPDTFNLGPEGYTQFADYNFASGAVSARNVTRTNHDMFCPGISTLGGGRIIITGGANAAKTSIYDPASNSFITGPRMNKARGYQASASMSDGRVFTIGGSWSGGVGNKTGEVFDPRANTWTLLLGASPAPMLTQDKEVSKRDNHAWLFGWKQGSVFQAGPSRRQNWYMTSNGGSVRQAGTRSGNDSMCAAFVMYDAGKILSVGGAKNYQGDAATASGHITTIGNPGQPSVIESIPDMSRPRAFPNAVVLPDGQVLVTGGQKTALPFTNTDGVWEAELFNPKTRTWTRMAPEAVTRAYHAASILLPDGRVWSGGGGLCFASPGQSTAGCDKSINHPDGQIFSPPYLFTRNGALAARPAISSVSNTQPRIGSTITVTMASPDAMTFAFVRMGTVTHSVNTDQRRIPVQATQSGSTYRIVLPSDSGVLLPGNWYLFALNANGVPSVARTIQVKL